jgi:hypothetical protein
MASRARNDDKRSKRKKRVRAHKLLVVFARLAYTSPGKKHDKQLTHIVRVSNWHFLEQSSPSDFNIKTLEK